MYNNYQMSISMFIICLLGKAISVLFYGLGYLASKKSNIPDVVEESRENWTSNISHMAEVKS